MGKLLSKVRFVRTSLWSVATPMLVGRAAPFCRAVEIRELLWDGGLSRRRVVVRQTLCHHGYDVSMLLAVVIVVCTGHGTPCRAVGCQMISSDGMAHSALSISQCHGTGLI